MSLSIHLPHFLREGLARQVNLRQMLASHVEVSHLEINMPTLPSDLEGFRVVHVSDLHVGEGMWGPEYAGEAAFAVHDAEPDLVVNTGDYLQGEPAISKVLEVAQAFVLGREPNSSHPATLSILGNHDYYAGPDMVDQLKSSLESHDVCLLVNTATCVEPDQGGISFVGLTDDEPGFEDGIAALLSAGRPRIVLLHEPDLAERLPSGSADLILAGHTHGGQFTIPGMEHLIVRWGCDSRYVAGMYTVNGMPMYVNRGLGCTGIPLRFRAHPEVTVIRLTR